MRPYWVKSPPRSPGPATGTGQAPRSCPSAPARPADANAELAPDQINLLFNTGRIPSALMYAALTEQDVLAAECSATA